MSDNYVNAFIQESKQILNSLDIVQIEKMVQAIVDVKARGGRLFFAGSGGGAGHSSHAVCDFRKLANIESYSVTDNVSELTARINDESWATAYANWLKVSRFGAKDGLFVFSVGGGDAEKKISENLVRAIDLANEVGASVVGIAGRDGGHLAKHSDACVVIPPIIASNVTTQTEGFQALIWHMIVCHPKLESATPMWESVS
jgi:D-sedoheptulose 7-phosphate isomerase